MIESGSLRITLLLLVFLSIFFSILSFIRIPYQLYVWEIFIDGKIIALVLFMIYLVKRSKLLLSSLSAPLQNFYWRRNILWYLFPVLAYSVVLLVGILTEEGKLDNFDNLLTLTLATLFDLPAVFVFSLAYLFIEEIVFRSVLLNSLLLRMNKEGTVMTISVLFALYCMSDVFTNDFSSALIFATLLLYFFSVGVITSALVLKYNSLWISYSFRIGLLTIAPLFLTSYLAESDSLFQTKNSLFFAEGIVFSLITLSIGFILLRSHVNTNDESQTAEKSVI